MHCGACGGKVLNPQQVCSNPLESVLGPAFLQKALDAVEPVQSNGGANDGGEAEEKLGYCSKESAGGVANNLCSISKVKNSVVEEVNLRTYVRDGKKGKYYS